MSKKKNEGHGTHSGESHAEGGASGGGELPVQHETGPTGDELRDQFLAAKAEYDAATEAIGTASAKLADAEHDIGKRLAAKGKSVEIVIGEFRYTAAKRKERAADGSDRYALRRVHDRTEVDL